MASFTPLVRPPLTQPVAVHPQRYHHPRVLIRHPGYRDLPNNILLSLPAVDSDADLPHARGRLGLHHRTALTAGAIIANNSFDKVYLTYDQAAQRPVGDTIALDGILGPGDYWLQLRGEEPPSTWFPHLDTSGPLQGGGALSTSRERALPPAPASPTSMPPPVRPAASPPTAQPSHPSATDTQTPTTAAEYEPYPIVPTFRDWHFPHHKLPPEWLSLGGPPRADPPSPAGPPAGPDLRSRRCFLTDLRMGVNRCHLIPSVQSEWFSINGMAEYTASVTGNIDDQANIALLRADLHLLFDQRRFVFVPKPSTVSPDYAFAVHVLNDDENTGELPELFQNVTVFSQELSREYLFARFAWALFPLLRNFLLSSARRRLAVIPRNTLGRGGLTADLWLSQTVWMNKTDFTAHLQQRDESLSGSRKRSLSRTSQDQIEASDRAFKERRARRSASIDNRDAFERSLDKADLWFRHHGQFATVGRLVGEDEDEDEQRGRSRRYRDRDVDGAPDAVSDINPDVPNLSLSCTTGSNRSSWTGLLGEGDDEDAWGGVVGGGKERRTHEREINKYKYHGRFAAAARLADEDEVEGR